MNKKIPVISLKRKAPIPRPVKPYKHFEIPRLWYNLPSLLLSNVTSLNNKLDEVTTTIKSVNPDIVTITEAWQVTPEVCEVENYQLFHHLRTDRRGGGLVLLAKNNLSPTYLNVQVPREIEVLWVKITPSCHPRHTRAIIHPTLLPVQYSWTILSALSTH